MKFIYNNFFNYSYKFNKLKFKQTDIRIIKKNHFFYLTLRIVKKQFMKTLKKEDIPKLGKKINQLKKRIIRTNVSGNLEKVPFRKMRIKKIKSQINEILKRKK